MRWPWVREKEYEQVSVPKREYSNCSGKTWQVPLDDNGNPASNDDYIIVILAAVQGLAAGFGLGLATSSVILAMVKLGWLK